MLEIIWLHQFFIQVICQIGYIVGLVLDDLGKANSFLHSANSQSIENLDGRVFCIIDKKYQLFQNHILVLDQLLPKCR